MVSTQLVEYIRNGIAKGNSPERLYEHLVMHGVDPSHVREAIDFVKKGPSITRPAQPVFYRKPEEKAPEKSHLKLYVALFIIALSLYLVFWYSTRPACGNGRIDAGETPDSCCQDTGCMGEQKCENGRCIDPKCGFCQYLEDHACKRYDCCSSEQCRDDEICSGNKCVKLDCGSCQFPGVHECMDHECCTNDDCSEEELCRSNRCERIVCASCQFIDHRMCLSYTCCSDSGCDDRDPDTIDLCAAPRTLNSRCLTIPRTPCTVNSDCNDSYRATRDFCDEGRCSADVIVSCRDGDQFCPPGCTELNDRDCLRGADSVDCMEDIQCFERNLRSCSPANYTSKLGIDIVFIYSIMGLDGNFCRIHHYAQKNPIASFSGTYYDCLLPSENLDLEKYDGFMAESMMESCTGTYIQLLYGSKCIQYSLAPGASIKEDGATIRLTEQRDEYVIVEVNGLGEKVPFEESRHINDVKITYVGPVGTKSLIAINCDENSI